MPQRPPPRTTCTTFAGHVPTARGVIRKGKVVLRGDRIVSVRPTHKRVPDRWILPGFVDIHVHGAAGSHFLHASHEDILKILKVHASHGTTSMLPTLETSGVRQLLHAMAKLKTFRQGMDAPAPDILGVNLEGPFLNPRRAGAQQVRYIRRPDNKIVEALLAEHRGFVKIMTLAPEQSGAIPMIRRLSGSGVLVACGHTDARAEEMEAAFRSGATLVTHAMNAMRPFGHRELGAAGAVLRNRHWWAEIIADGIHLSRAFLRFWGDARGWRRTILITDATLGLDAANGAYQAFGRRIVVRAGKAALHNGTLAGSLLGMDQALRMVVQEAGVPMAFAWRMLSLHPAKLLGMDRRTGSIARGKQADLVILDNTLRVQETWARGEKIFG